MCAAGAAFVDCDAGKRNAVRRASALIAAADAHALRALLAAVFRNPEDFLGASVLKTFENK